MCIWIGVILVNRALESSMRFWPLLLGMVYLVVIAVFGEVYLDSSDFSKKMENRVDSYYFSVVTITTLGYGDIYPIQKKAKIQTAVQTLSGVLLLGLFLLYLARSQSEEEAKSRKIAQKKVFIKQYEYFRRRIIASSIDAAAMARSEQKKPALDNLNGELVEKLLDPQAFDDFFSQKGSDRWYDVQNGMNWNLEIVSDMHLELNLLNTEIRSMLSAVVVDDEVAYAWLTGFYQDTLRIVHGRHTKDDPGKYLSNFFYAILANRSSVDSSPVDDRLRAAVKNL